METPRTQPQHVTQGQRPSHGSSASTPDMASTLADHLAAHDVEMRRIDSDLEAIRALKMSLGSLRKEAHARLRDLTEPAPTIESALAAVTLGLAANKRPDVTLPEEMTEIIAEILDCALTNVAQHAAATETTLSVKVEDRWIFVSLFDDGQGGAVVAPDHTLDRIRHRVNQASGHFSLSSPDQRGTLLTVALPFAAPTGPASPADTSSTATTTTSKELPR